VSDLSANSANSSRRRIYRTLCVALMAWPVARVLQIIPEWVTGARPAYPGQYLSRLLNAVIMVGILGSVLVGQSDARATRRGIVTSWILLAAAIAALVAAAASGSSPSWLRATSSKRDWKQRKRSARKWPRGLAAELSR
jgi:hypothetical protein